MSKMELLHNTADASWPTYLSGQAKIYVWENNQVNEISVSTFLSLSCRSALMYKYIYVSDPGMGRWTKALSWVHDGEFYMFKKNHKKPKPRNQEHQMFKSALYLAPRSIVPKEFLTALMLLGIDLEGKPND